MPSKIIGFADAENDPEILRQWVEDMSKPIVEGAPKTIALIRQAIKDARSKYGDEYVKQVFNEWINDLDNRSKIQ